MANAAEIAREWDRVMAASLDPMAVTDGEKHVTVNEPYADLHGFSRPEDLAGESWNRCLAADERTRFEQEIVPTCRDEGIWRGTVTGRKLSHA